MIDNSLGDYISQLQLIAFFSGYPLIYSIACFMAGWQPEEKLTFFKKITVFLPFAYAFTGTLFLGFVLKSLSPDFQFKDIVDQFHTSYLKVWGFLAILFWLPLFNKKPLLALLHSLVFFFLLIKDIFIHIISFNSIDIIKNDMKFFTFSVILNAIIVAVTLMIHFIFCSIKKNKRILTN